MRRSRRRAGQDHKPKSGMWNVEVEIKKGARVRVPFFCFMSAGRNLRLLSKFGF